MDVIVVGGGIIGLSAAYYLAERGANVTLFEKDTLGNGSTARSAGGIRSQFSTPINVRLSMASKRVWNAFEEDFGVDIAYRKSGYLFLARSKTTAETFRDNVAMQQELGAESVYLSPEEATTHCPGLHTEDFVGTTYNHDDGFADPNLAVQGFAQQARDLGVDIHTKTPVTDIRRDGERVVGIETPSARFQASFVVNAAGGFAGKVSDMADVDLPIEPKRRQIVTVDPSETVPESVPLTIDLETGSYFRPERDGNAIVGGHFDSEDPSVDPETYSTSMDIDWAIHAVERAAEYSDYFGPATRIQRGWAGLYAVTPDDHPIIEETIPGLVTAAGFSGHGFQHSPATGQIVAELVFDGRPKLVDVSTLNSDRFEAGDLLVERNVA